MLPRRMRRSLCCSVIIVNTCSSYASAVLTSFGADAEAGSVAMVRHLLCCRANPEARNRDGDRPVDRPLLHIFFAWYVHAFM